MAARASPALSAGIRPAETRRSTRDEAVRAAGAAEGAGGIAATDDALREDEPPERDAAGRAAAAAAGAGGAKRANREGAETGQVTSLDPWSREQPATAAQPDAGSVVEAE
jgi:hypothetical protein